jgi:hypothetical protein
MCCTVAASRVQLVMFLAATVYHTPGPVEQGSAAFLTIFSSWNKDDCRPPVSGFSGHPRLTATANAATEFRRGDD